MYRVGVDLGGTNIVAGVINEEMKITGRGKLKTNCPRAAEAILEDVAKAVEAAVIDAGITMNDVVSVGIGTPGSVNKKNGVIEYANNLAFDNVPARDILESRLKKTIYLDNDANCAALGEAKAASSSPASTMPRARWVIWSSSRTASPAPADAEAAGRAILPPPRLSARLKMPCATIPIPPCGISSVMISAASTAELLLMPCVQATRLLKKSSISIFSISQPA